ncbi:WXG100 family type VII secretion target [Kitasatospora sp. NPDC004531]
MTTRPSTRVSTPPPRPQPHQQPPAQQPQHPQGQQQQPSHQQQPQQQHPQGQQQQPQHPGGQQQEPQHGNGQQQRPANNNPGEEPADGGDGPVDPREGWFSGLLREGASTAVNGLAQRGTDWVGNRVFGPREPEPGAGASPSTGLDGVGEGGAAGGEAGVGGAAGGGLGAIIGAAAAQAGAAGVGGSGRIGHEMIAYGEAPPGMLDRQSSAYAWAHAQVEQAMANLDPAQHPDRNGLGGMLDEAVVWALEQSGLMDMLEKVTGNLAELNAAAEEWQAQARAVHSVAAELRAGAQPLSEVWAGSASDSFGGHMGEVADALDQTAKGMEQTAQIINSAAQECAMAEGMVIEIISEAIEALIVSLAAEAVLAVVTLGIGLIADALITEAEIAVFVARVARVSTQLAQKLEELLKAVKEMGAAVKAVRNLKGISNALSSVKKVQRVAGEIRQLEEGESRIAQAAKALDGKVTDWGNNQLRDALRIDEDDPVQRGDGTWKGNLKAAGQSAWAVGKEGLTSDTNKEAIKQELLHDVGLAHDPAPYRVDESRIATAFG